MRKSTDGVLTLPAVAVSLLPKVACPVCASAYTALLSGVSLGFLGTTYLLPVTVGLLALAIAALASRASDRWGWGPLAVGVVGPAAVLGGKFWLGSDSTSYVGASLLVAASIWSAIPTQKTSEACPACPPTAPRLRN